MTPAEKIVTSAARLARRSGYVTVEKGVRLHYVAAGQGPPVVLLHGFPAFSLMWEAQIDALAAAGFCAVAPDLRGYASSDKPRGVAAYGVRVLARDVARLIAALGTGAAGDGGGGSAKGDSGTGDSGGDQGDRGADSGSAKGDSGTGDSGGDRGNSDAGRGGGAAANISDQADPATSSTPPVTAQRTVATPTHVGAGRGAAVVGHDWGGIIAYALAMDYPQVLDKLVIINAPHPGTFGSFLLRHPDQIRRSAYMALFQLPWLPEAIIKAKNFAVIRRELHDARFIHPLTQPRALTSALNYYRAVWRGGLRSLRALRKPIATQTLVIWGDKDTYLSPELAQPDPRLVPNAGVIHMPDNGHWVPLEAPDAVNAKLIDFLDPR